jgi:hypothetical protein
VEEAEVDGSKGRARVRFGRSGFAEEILNDVRDGIRRNVSVGYEVHEMVLEKSGDDGETYRITDWEPLEISIVSVPADASVGVGRSKEDDEKKDEKMNEKVKKHGVQVIDDDATAVASPQVEVKELDWKGTEAVRIGEIQAIAKQFPQAKELADSAILTRESVSDFRARVLGLLEKSGTIQKVDASCGKIGMDDKEQKRYSLLRAIQAKSSGDWSKAGLELEASQAAAKLRRRDAADNGFIVPDDILLRDMTTTSGSAGGYLVGTDVGPMIQKLDNRMLVDRLGATVITGLIGDFALPKEQGG